MLKRLVLLLFSLVLLGTTACTSQDVSSGGGSSDSTLQTSVSDSSEESEVSSSMATDSDISDTEEATLTGSSDGSPLSSDSAEQTSSNSSQKETSDTATDTEATDSTVSEDIPDTPDALEVLTGGVDKTEILTGDLIATSVCTLRNLPVSNAVQRFFIVEVEGNVYIFTTQRSGTTTYLSRCRYDPKTKYAYCIDSLTLADYGHGESLEVRVRDGKVYVYVGTESNPANSYAWSLGISRFVYDKGKKLEEKKLTDFQFATKDGTPLHANATSYRINFSFNEESDRVLIYARCDTNHQGGLSHYFVSYRLSELDRILDEASGAVSMNQCTSAFLAHHGEVSYKKFCPYGSFQGMDLCTDGATLYISGGAEGQQPQVYRAHLTETGMESDELCNITKIYAARTGMEKEYITTQRILPEIESFQQFNGRFYVSFNPGSGLKKNNTEIFVLSLAS